MRCPTLAFLSLPIVTVTGLRSSWVAYRPEFRQSIPGDVGWLHLPTFDWPTRPSWLYRLNQGVHVGLGLILAPWVPAKLWSVIPKFLQMPPVTSNARAPERISLLALVGGILFEMVTGVLDIQYDYVVGFSFYTAHYRGAWAFVAGFVVHVAVKWPAMWRSVVAFDVLGAERPCDGRPNPSRSTPRDWWPSIRIRSP
ncbi:hypothetical protein MARA_39740 [Mycolicibacterium arabiense]|uniref:Uncharacterized protein n=1 Tax=Mycolicibacterium arabiense TaxID=1286181 RepID=A0A7I7S2I2_9MYCO|nr:hypothetical protein MARA_39740 [Mycolicibacterium arabiense]